MAEGRACRSARFRDASVCTSELVSACRGGEQSIFPLRLGVVVT
jgi:hypothetical protein